MTYEEGIGRGRVWFLRLLYELSGEDGDRALSFDRIGDELGFDRKRTSEIVRTLVSELLWKTVYFSTTIWERSVLRAWEGMK